MQKNVGEEEIYMHSVTNLLQLLGKEEINQEMPRIIYKGKEKLKEDNRPLANVMVHRKGGGKKRKEKWNQ